MFHYGSNVVSPDNQEEGRVTDEELLMNPEQVRSSLVNVGGQRLNVNENEGTKITYSIHLENAGSSYVNVTWYSLLHSSHVV